MTDMMGARRNPEPAVGVRRVVVESVAGDRFQAEIPINTPLKELAADFYADRGWPLRDAQGRGQRAVVELVNPQDPDDTKRLNGEDNLDQAHIRDGDTLRIFPEAIAGAVDQHERMRALQEDYNAIVILAERNPRIRFRTNRDHAPDEYTVTLDLPSFIELPPGQDVPRIAAAHEVEIVLGANYPRSAPRVRWLTPIFHPNIAPLPSGEVCLGVLRDRYLPSLGLARLVNMLVEIIQWRSFDLQGVMNQEAARWASDPGSPEKARQIKALGGYPVQEEIAELLEKVRGLSRPRIAFHPLGTEREARTP